MITMPNLSEASVKELVEELSRRPLHHYHHQVRTVRDHLSGPPIIRFHVVTFTTYEDGDEAEDWACAPV
jgi:hypothetical protein